ncbi:hypothetical protein QBC44DRAFT_328397 [Cladorrhinum sp. PSN332]|nr:hypothetical protein QBC44DRAFT_328397 [Cladorrhinum sp. PSN332]
MCLLACLLTSGAVLFLPIAIVGASIQSVCLCRVRFRFRCIRPNSLERNDSDSFPLIQPVKSRWNLAAKENSKLTNRRGCRIRFHFGSRK